MTEPPPVLSVEQLQNMTKDEIIAYLASSETPPASEAMSIISVRLPAAMVAALDELAARDKEGRSGLIRQAVEELLGRRRGGAARA